MNNPKLRLQVGQQLAMTPQLLQSIRMLQLSSVELEQELREALEQNPMLEQDESEEAVADSEVGAEAAAEETADVETPAAVQDVVAQDPGYDDEWSPGSASGSGSDSSEDDNPIEERTAAPESDDVRVRALEQLRLNIRSEREGRIAVALVEAVDDNGYLEASLADIAHGLDDMDVTEAEVAAVLEKVQGVEPSGFAARDLKECLQLQLRDLPRETEGLVLAEQIVNHGLDVLAAQDRAGLQARLQADEAQLDAAIHLVLSLNPKPAATAAVANRVIVPDVIVSGRPGSWKVELNAETLPRVRINALYEKLLSNAPSHRALREQLQEARWLVRGLEMRNTTLLNAARAIFARQSGFLDRGEEGMMPLTLREVADAIQMHESTVCRVTTSKYVQTPWGVYELKAFFPSHITGAEAETSGTAVKAMIRRIIDNESRTSPLCDGAIAALLHRQGVRVARRTVAKYREAMRIASAKERRVTAERKGRRLLSAAA